MNFSEEHYGDNSNLPASSYVCTNCQHTWQTRKEPEECPICKADKLLIEKYHTLL